MSAETFTLKLEREELRQLIGTVGRDMADDQIGSNESDLLDSIMAKLKELEPPRCKSRCPYMQDGFDRCQLDYGHAGEHERRSVIDTKRWT